MNLLSSELDSLEEERKSTKEPIDTVDECTTQDTEKRSRRHATQGRIREHRNKRPVGPDGISLCDARKDSSAVLVEVVS